MPKRDRNHELETESQRAFEMAMPSSLVVRPISDDYGVDREVEIFVDGKTTGLTFKVQLKGTDKSGASRRIRRAHLEYWRSLDVPVLLVSYEAPSKALRGRWVHSIGFEGPDNGSETLTVHMDPTLDFTNLSSESLARDLALIRALLRGDFPTPTPVRVQTDPSLELSESQISAAIFSIGRRTRAPMRAATADEAALTISFESDRVQAGLPLRVGSCTLRVPNAEIAALSTSRLASLALLLAAAAASTVNDEHARQWMTAVSAEEPFWAVDGLVERLLPMFDRPETADLLLAVHRHLATQDEPAADLYLIPLMDRVRDVDAERFEEETAAVEEHVRAHANGGRLAFNLANLYRVRGSYAKAVELYQVAAAGQPRYLEDPLYLRVLGACHWELGAFSDSAEVYQRSLDLGFDPHELRPLLADSLMHAGKYARARAVLEQWEPVGAASDRAGLLRIAMLDHLLTFVGIDEQDRERYSAEAAQRAYESARDASELSTEVLVKLLRDFDALHPLPWMHLIGLDENRVSFESALMVAYLLETSAMAWVLALVGALQADAAEPLLKAVIDQARYACGEDFYDATLEFASNQDAEHAAFLRELISAAYSAEPETLTSHLRTIDATAPDWVVEQVSFPARPV